ncbi:FtsZ family, C-terminal domain [Halorubrum aquaticum]|uniref:FtsZ family, C-terminal domain n=1 Tax=Halorubrum aquaticum TaxID=387340 RepID=A0A1I3C846_9EURY|nr:zinc finger domain-containing protein [Halorubrum aquaticum]SFH70677.1 FtsZ family, C-terminal domain [Halorubrum aquaticum]
MVSSEDLRRRADALDGSVVVCGIDGDATPSDGAFPGARVATTAELVAGGGGDPDDVAAVLVVVDPTLDSDRTPDALDTLDAVDAFTVAVVPAGVDAESLAAVRRRVDATLLAGDGGAEEAIRTFLEAVQRPGFVNLDLADARTALSTGVAALGTGAAETGSGPTADRDAPEVALADPSSSAAALDPAPATAVDAAFARLPEGVDPAGASAVLVDVVVDPETSIAAATDAIAAVRERVGADANVIWGGAVDDSAADEIAVRVVVADVEYAPPPDGGDPCPRCGAPLSTYAFGARETLSCDGCGYSGIPVDRD